MWVIDESEGRALDYDKITSIDVQLCTGGDGKNHYKIIASAPHDCVNLLTTEFKPKITEVLRELSRAYMVGKLVWKYGEDV